MNILKIFTHNHCDSCGFTKKQLYSDGSYIAMCNDCWDIVKVEEKNELLKKERKDKFKSILNKLKS